MNENKEHMNQQIKGKGKQTLVNKDGKVNAPAFTEASKQYKGKTGYK